MRDSMRDTLQAFALIYAGSAAAKHGGARDYQIGYEKFLRIAGLADGDERECAERDLRAAEHLSGGCLTIERHRRTHEPQLIRLSMEGGEAWLFEQIGNPAPSASRQELAAFLASARDASVASPWQERWHAWFDDLAQRAVSGESIQPFKRDDEPGNSALLTALKGVLDWQGEALIRYASASICGDSKSLQALEPRLRPALEAITGHASLEAFGIHRKPRSVHCHGPLVLALPAASHDFSTLPGPYSLTETNLHAATAIRTNAPLCLTVENEDVFHALAMQNPGVLLVQTSYAGSAALHLLKQLPDHLPCYHFGDSDPAGSDILRDLRDRTGRTIAPLPVRYATRAIENPLTEQDRRMLKRLLERCDCEEQQQTLAAMLASGSKGAFEQELIPIKDVLAAIDQSRQAAGR